MAEYIEREALIKSFSSEGCHFIYGEPTVKAIISRINNTPTADVVPVVRCKDCEHYKTDSYYCQKTKQGYCELDNNVKQKQGYCSYGERRCKE